MRGTQKQVADALADNTDKDMPITGDCGIRESSFSNESVPLSFFDGSDEIPVAIASSNADAFLRKLREGNVNFDIAGVQITASSTSNMLFIRRWADGMRMQLPAGSRGRLASLLNQEGSSENTETSDAGSDAPTVEEQQNPTGAQRNLLVSSDATGITIEYASAPNGKLRIALSRD
ncbi:MAG: hypothetical protein IIT36_00055 [Aeriscardovia sp.]|nr:hypothetical protein [Aeriscardovia sp.]